MVELTLFHGDCLKVMKEIPAQSIDLIICDLPYGCLYVNNERKTELKRADRPDRPNTREKLIIGCDWDVKINLEEFWKEVKRIRKNNHTPCIHFCTTKFGAELIQSNPSEFRYDLVWDKNRGINFLSANRMPMRSHEMIYVFSKDSAFYQRIDEDSGDRVRCSLSVINIDKKIIHNTHPTEKPEDLYKWLIKRYCPPGGTVLDPTFGSGNSVFTAYTLGRNAIGIEMNETFFKKAEERLEKI